MAKVTIDMLAVMMNKSFEHLEKELKGEIREVNNRLDKLENNHERRITILEDDVRVLKTTVGR